MATEKRSDRLQPVARLAQDREQQAGRLLGERRQLLQQYRQQLQELESYREEYLQRLQQAARNGIGAITLRHYQSFVGKLSEAIMQQQRIAEEAQQGVEEARNAWFQSRNRTKMVDSVMVNARTEEQRQELRSEQRESDERAQRGSR